MPYLSSILGAYLLLFSLPLSAAVLQAYITGVDTTQGGYIIVGVYDNKATFLKDDGPVAEARLAVADAQEGRIVAIFEELALNKKYAIAVFHDANDNKILDKNFFGVPKEGYGFSNNARGLLGPPDFDDVVFLLDQENKTTSLYLSY
jgi:uncharacterized protein (DUF2141 family)